MDLTNTRFSSWCCISNSASLGDEPTGDWKGTGAWGLGPRVERRGTSVQGRMHPRCKDSRKKAETCRRECSIPPATPTAPGEGTSPLCRRRNSFKTEWGKPAEDGGSGREAATGFGNLVKLGAPDQEPNLDFHLGREPGLSWDFQIRSFTSGPPPGCDFLTSRLVWPWTSPTVNSLHLSFSHVGHKDQD